MEDRNSEGYAFRRDIEDIGITANGTACYEFQVYETLEAALEQCFEGEGPGDIVRVRVTIEELGGEKPNV